jgi:hypothetical protein
LEIEFVIGIDLFPDFFRPEELVPSSVFVIELRKYIFKSSSE